MPQHRFPFVAEYSTQDPAGEAWIDVLGGYADGMASTWQRLASIGIIEIRFATAEQRETFIKRILAIEHVRPAKIYEDAI